MRLNVPPGQLREGESIIFDCLIGTLGEQGQDARIVATKRGAELVIESVTRAASSIPIKADFDNRPERPPLPVEGPRFERRPIAPGLECEG